MTIIIVPSDLCNAKCVYCFEPEEQRHSSEPIPLDIDAIRKSLYEIWSGPYGGSDVTLHGGECTLISRLDFEKLLDMMYNLPYKKEDGTITYKGVSNIVTNGIKIDDYLIQLFKKYNTYVSISIDGPVELNRLRGPDPSLKPLTDIYNIELEHTLEKLRENEIPVSVMCILHKMNASTPEQRERMREWFLWLKSIGIYGGRTNPAYFYTGRKKELEITNEELFEFYKMIYELNKSEGLDWKPIKEMISNLKGDKVSPCSFHMCDYFNTHTISILPDGTIGNCDRTFQDGIYLRSLDRGTSGRYEALIQTQCKGCRYWNVCGGGCPAEGYDDDWRNKTRFCEAYYNMYSLIEKEIKYLNPSIKLNLYTEGQQSTIQERPNVEHGDSPHGDSNHGDTTHGDGVHADMNHADLSHGDLGHGDVSHGDGVHGDLGHGDIAHGDMNHGDIAHGDISHGDMDHGDSAHGDFADWKRMIEDE